MLIHTVFDIFAWLSGAAIGILVSRRGWLSALLQTRSPFSDPPYFIALAFGAIAGAILFGSLNLDLAGRFVLGHSIAGAIAGGIVAVEAYKSLAGVKGSTGGQFVAPLALGIAVGRWGCFFAGLPDYTYGTPTSLPWGINFGDGIPRHPVQLYEIIFMLVLGFLLFRWFQRPHVSGDIFKGFMIAYACFRLFVDFLKPYPRFAGFATLQWACIAVLAYYAPDLWRWFVRAGSARTSEAAA